MEAPLPLDVDICDAHFHLYDTKDPDRSFPGTYSPAQLHADAAGFRIAQGVFAECGQHYTKDASPEMRPVGETKWVCTQDPNAKFITGIVGFADLSLGEAVSEVLAAHVEAATGRRFCGVRHSTTWDPAPEMRLSHMSPPRGLLATKAFGEGCEALEKMGMTYDAFMFFHQLEELVPFARAHPQLTIVLNHLGGFLGIGPYKGKRGEVLSEWRAKICKVAACENVVMKVGGLGRPKAGFGWESRTEKPNSMEVYEAWKDPVSLCFDLFGPDRCIFESNFPVDGQAISYTSFVNALIRMTASLSRDERRAYFHDTAARVYRLPSRVAS